MASRPDKYRPSAQARDVQPRASARDRGYTTQWDLRRKQWLLEQWQAITDLDLLARLPNCLPPCVDCLPLGRVVEATEIDHEVPHRGDQALFWDESNWTPRCKPCHSRKTRRGL